MSDLLTIRNLQVGFRSRLEDGSRTVAEAVKGVSFSVPENGCVALVGESGSGKSVSALAAMGLLPKESAVIGAGSEILFAGRDLLALDARERRAVCGKEIAMIFQEPMSSLNPVFTVGFQIGEALRLHLGMDAKQARARSIELLGEVGIPDPGRRVDAYPGQLSGGQQQRMMIAMAIACRPRLLIADEPTTALDVTIQQQIMALLADLRRRYAMSVLFITHDLALVAEIADRVVVMRDGRVREYGEAAQVFGAPADAYTRALLQCRPRIDSRPAHLPVIADFLGEDGRAAEARVDTAQRHRGLDDLPAGEKPLLEVSGLSKSFFSREGLFGRREFKAVQNVSFKLFKGRTLGIVGESGSGKTTVGLTLLRLHEATAGRAEFEGRDILAMSRGEFQPFKRRMQIVFQNPYASLNPRFTVGRILLEPMRIHGIGADDAEREAIALQLLRKVGLPESAYRRYPHEFSGGQRQRIAIARCLTLRPEILVCDESVSALDVSVQAQVLNLLQDLQDEFDLSYIFISHDLAVVKYISDQVMVMHEGRVVETADADALYADPRHPYTRNLLAAIPGGLGRA
ncbi:MAG: ABC transporter ATP-binding protein [Candidatus Protistobacter heckmanni]|nr:ABC transporter ATP-binding protein [Candidatus Protistobacter heckmanni]